MPSEPVTKCARRWSAMAFSQQTKKWLSNGYADARLMPLSSPHRILIKTGEVPSGLRRTKGDGLGCPPRFALLSAIVSAWNCSSAGSSPVWRSSWLLGSGTYGVVSAGCRSKNARETILDMTSRRISRKAGKDLRRGLCKSLAGSALAQSRRRRRSSKSR